jgi:hypothetical protein
MIISTEDSETFINNIFHPTRERIEECQKRNSEVLTALNYQETDNGYEVNLLR